MRPTTGNAVLIVDDNAIEREVLSAMLRAIGVETILQAGDGRAALEILASRDVALVICDLAMPDMDGIELIRALAAARSAAALFLVTGAETKLRTLAEAYGSKAGLRVVGGAPKPVPMERLRAAVLAAVAPLRTGAAAGVAVDAAELRTALAAGQIEVVYLPRVSLRSGRPEGVEALSRWRHPVHGLLSPDHFIPLAEASGLIWDLTLQVCESAVRQVGRWRAEGLPLQLSVNICARGRGGVHFPDELLRMARRAWLEPAMVMVELTESELACSPEIYDVIGRLCLRGFGLSVDDFGMGHSGIEQLRRLPYRELKIDRSFVSGVASDMELQSIVGSAAALAHSLGMRVVAEGVERREDWCETARLGCESAQGFLISRPIGAADVPVWAERWTEYYAREATRYRPVPRLPVPARESPSKH